MSTPAYKKEKESKKTMEKKIYLTPSTEVINVETDEFIAASPVIFDGGDDDEGQGVNADEVITIGG